MQRPLKDELPFLSLMFPNCYVRELSPAVSAAWSVPHLKSTVGIDLGVWLSTFYTIPIVFPSVTEAHVPVPVAAIHLVYPNIALNGESVLFR